MRRHDSQEGHQDCVSRLEDAMQRVGGWGSTQCCSGEGQIGIVLDAAFPSPVFLVAHYVRALVVPTPLAAAVQHVACAAPRSRDLSLDRSPAPGHGVDCS